MAALRNLVIAALRLAGVTNIAAALRHDAGDTSRAHHLQDRVTTLPPRWARPSGARSPRSSYAPRSGASPPGSRSPSRGSSGSDPVTYTGVLPIGEHTAVHLAQLLAGERRDRRTRRGRRAVGPWRQAVLVLRWFLDGTRVAVVVVQVATMADPPRRLLLGSDAVAAAAAAGQARVTEDAAWEAVSRSTDRDAALPCPRANSTPWQPSPTPQRPPPTDRSASRRSHSPWRRPS
jgi:hypothetical protein